MSPTLAMNNIPDMRYGHIEPFRKVALLCALRKKQSDFLHIGICQLCAWMGFALEVPILKRCLSALFSHVAQVISLCSKPEVSRVTAKWIVSLWAIVANAYTFGDWAKVDFPTDAMRALDTISIMNTSVAAVVWWALPQPTFIYAALVNMAPKAFLDRELRLNPAVVAANKSTRLARNVTFGRVADRGNWRGLSTSAHTNAGEIGRQWFWISSIGVVARQIAQRFTLDLAASGIRAFCNWGRVAASTFAQFRGIIGAHKKFTFLVSKPRAFRDAAGHFLLGFYSFILAYFGNKYQWGNA